MPSDELTLPLIYWSAAPDHVITALLVHESLRFGHILITGSENGEFVIWRRRSMLDPDGDDEDDAMSTINGSEWTTESDHITQRVGGDNNAVFRPTARPSSP